MSQTYIEEICEPKDYLRDIWRQKDGQRVDMLLSLFFIELYGEHFIYSRDSDSP